MGWRPDCASVASARAMESRMSLTPDSTADKAIKSALNASAINRARVVLPTPGGPQRIIECGLPVANATASGLPGASRWRCPMTSATFLGRKRSASGAAGLAMAKRSASTRSAPAQCPLSSHSVPNHIRAGWRRESEKRRVDRRIALERIERQLRHLAEVVVQLHRSRQIFLESDANPIEAGVRGFGLWLD